MNLKEMTTDDLRRRLTAGEDIAVVDIREKDEYDEWHIAGSSNVPVYNAINMGNQDFAAGKLRDLANRLLKGKPVVAVCRMGNTSKFAAYLLSEMGCDAYSLTGGMHGWSTAWTEARLPLRSAQGGSLFQIRRNGKGCLSYLFGSNGAAAVVDACVDTAVYTTIAQREGLAITHVIETHVHADHISRARALCQETGAELCVPKNDRCRFPYTALTDGQTLRVGNTTVTVIATPGHTLESASFDLDGEVLLSGDTLFVENIGRPDLEKGDAGAEVGARLLFDSLHGKVLEMKSDLLVCPGHTAMPIGFDGEPIAAKLADIRPRIDLLKLEKEAFVKAIIASLGQKPPNFQRVLAVNEGRAELGWLDPLDLEAGPNRCAVR